MPQVNSSNIASVDYDESSGQMIVAFRKGARYLYENVPEQVYQDLLTAPSAGSYFSDFVRDVFPYRRVG